MEFIWENLKIVKNKLGNQLIVVMIYHFKKSVIFMAMNLFLNNSLMNLNHVMINKLKIIHIIVKMGLIKLFANVNFKQKKCGKCEKEGNEYRKKFRNMKL